MSLNSASVAQETTEDRHNQKKSRTVSSVGDHFGSFLRGGGCFLSGKNI